MASSSSEQGPCTLPRRQRQRRHGRVGVGLLFALSALSCPSALVRASPGSQPSCTSCQSSLGCPNTWTVPTGQGVKWTYYTTDATAYLDIQYTITTNLAHGLFDLWLENTVGCQVPNTYLANATCSGQTGQYGGNKVSLVAYCNQPDNPSANTCTFRKWDQVVSTTSSSGSSITPSTSYLSSSEQVYYQNQCYGTPSTVVLPAGAIVGIVFAALFLFALISCCLLASSRMPVIGQWRARYLYARKPTVVPVAAPTVQASAYVPMQVYGPGQQPAAPNYGYMGNVMQAPPPAYAPAGTFSQPSFYPTQAPPTYYSNAPAHSGQTLYATAPQATQYVNGYGTLPPSSPGMNHNPYLVQQPSQGFAQPGTFRPNAPPS